MSVTTVRFQAEVEQQLEAIASRASSEQRLGDQPSLIGIHREAATRARPLAADTGCNGICRSRQGGLMPVRCTVG